MGAVYETENKKCVGKDNLGICVIICLHYGDMCKSCIKQKRVCFYLCVLLCKGMQHCVSVEIHLSA